MPRIVVAMSVFFALLVLALGIPTPVFAQRSTPIQLLHPAGAAGDSFGWSVAVDGDTMIVGASLDDVGANVEQGSAHIYRWTGSGWTHEATLVAAGGAASDEFGISVAISGDTVIVGAAFDDVGFSGNQGSAYVFTRSGSTWTQQAQLTASDGLASDQFGISVAISGDTAIVGANLDDVGTNINQGSAYVFTRSGTTWTQQARLTAADGATADLLGASVAISGDTAIVGAWGDDVGAIGNQGSAYVFIRSGSAWTQQAQLTAANGAASDQFGISVAISGDTAIVGANAADVGATSNQGSAYVFMRSGTTWTQQAQLTAADGAANDQFGLSVAISGDSALVGVPFDDIGANVDQGSAYVFTRSGSTWTQQTRLNATGGAVSDNFGFSVAIAGDTALVGVYFDDIGANFNQGSAWTFSRLGTRWIGPDFIATAADGAAFDQFGISVAISGDTALVGAFTNDIGANTDQGSAYVFVRSGLSWIQQAQLTASDGAGSDNFGWSVAISGDTAIVGANLNDVGTNVNQGSAYVFTRSGTSWTQQAQLTAADGAANDRFGVSVALVGDTALVGANFDDVGVNADQGSAYVFTRSGTTWTQQARLNATGGAVSDNFGISVAISGDTALVGADRDDVDANVDQGSAYVFTRAGTTWTQQVQLTAADGAGSDNFGISVAISGDTAIVGAYFDNIGANSAQGSAYVFVRSGTNWTQQAQLTAADGAAFDLFGSPVAISGNSALVGAPGDDIGANVNQGSAYVFVRSGTSWTQQAQLTVAGGAALDQFGSAIAISGDTAISSTSRADVGANVDQGLALIRDGIVSDLSFASNDVTGVVFPTLAAAMLPAVSGQQITATETAWRGIGSLNTLGRSLSLRSSGDLRFPSTSSLELGGSSTLALDPGNAIDVFGQFRISSGASADVSADVFTLGSRGLLTARTGSSLTINAPVANLDGQTRVEQGAALTFANLATAIGPTTLGAGSSLTVGGLFENIDTLSITNATLSLPLLLNRSTFNVFGGCAIFGSFTNNAGALTSIRGETLFVFGSLTNNGTIIGTICASCRNGTPDLDVAGTLSLGPDASLLLPFTSSVVSVGGSFDCAINANTRYDLSVATLKLQGTGSEQTLEVMSRDIGPVALGLDRTLPGHFPIGTLRIGPSASTVRLVDTHDNDGLGQGACEAIYVNTLRIEAGSRLINPTCKIYCLTLVNNGVIDFPANVVVLGGSAVCDSLDFNQDGDFPTPLDLEDFINANAGSLCGTCSTDLDFNNDGDFPTPLDIEAFISVNAGGPCL